MIRLLPNVTIVAAVLVLAAWTEDGSAADKTRHRKVTRTRKVQDYTGGYPGDPGTTGGYANGTPYASPYGYSQAPAAGSGTTEEHHPHHAHHRLPALGSAAWGQSRPDRTQSAGWPWIGVYRHDLPYPDESESPRMAELAVVAPPGSRVYMDGKEIEFHAKEGVFRHKPKDPLWPDVAYIREVRVESPTGDGVTEIARTVTVYMRLGRVTVLTFE